MKFFPVFAAFVGLAAAHATSSADEVSASLPVDEFPTSLPSDEVTATSSTDEVIATSSIAEVTASSSIAEVTATLPADDETCAPTVTVTVTECAVHTPVAPTSLAVTDPAPYPTGNPAADPFDPVLGGAQPSGTSAPSGTGAYSAPPTEFTGAASSIKVGGALAAGAVVALFL